MKKMGLLMTLASVLVVGGVYATWSYSQGEIASMSDEYSVVMTAETVNGTKGTFNVSSSTVTFEIGNQGNYHPELRGNGEVEIAFTPSVGADTAVLENGIDVSWTLSVTDDGLTNWKYDSDFDGEADRLFFNLHNGVHTITKEEAYKVPQQGKFIYKISVSDILHCITLNVEDDFVLDTKAKYDSFKSYLDDYKFVLTVTEAA